MRTSGDPVTQRDADGVKHERKFGGYELSHNRGIGRRGRRSGTAQIAVIAGMPGQERAVVRRLFGGTRSFAVADDRERVDDCRRGQSAQRPPTARYAGRSQRPPSR